MTVADFSESSFKEQHRFVFSQGDYITHKVYYNQKRVLYRCEDILVEVWYDPFSNRIVEFDIIDIDTALNFYWEEIG